MSTVDDLLPLVALVPQLQQIVQERQITIPAELKQKPSTLWRPEQLAEYIDRSPKSLERDRREGVGVPFIRVGKHIRYRIEDIEEYLESRTYISTSQKMPPRAHQPQKKAVSKK